MSVAHGTSLAAMGWDRRLDALFAEHAARGLLPARVLSEQRGSYHVAGPTGELTATITGRFRNDVTSAEDYPAVGDWLALAPAAGSQALVQAVLPRRSRFARPARGDIPGAQVVAANVDMVFVVAALDHDFNLRRLERYMALAWSSGAEPVILLNKADVCPDVVEKVAEVHSVAPGVPVYALSAREGVGLEAVEHLLEGGRTVCLLGSSGVGKSTIVNALLGWERQDTGEVRADDQRGRHTTTSRELLVTPSGALLIDSPGMRSVGMWDAEEGLDATFADIEELAAGCRFSDCGHGDEPACAVQAAIGSGELSEARLRSRQKLARESAALARRVDPEARANSKRKWKQIHKSVRNHMRVKYGPDGA